MKRKFEHKRTEWTAITHTSIPKSYRLEHDDELIAVPAELIENSQDWQEVTKDYEVLSWTYPPNKAIYVKDGQYHKAGDITSVKRLSDGEVVSIDDDVHNTNYPHHKGKVYEITEKRGSIYVYYTPKRGCDLLKDIQKSRKPILTTEDGVELFEGDKHWWINTEHSKLIIRGPSETTGVDEFADDDILYFSTREAAEEYRLWNYRGLSLDDVGQFLFAHRIEDIKELVKSRL